MNITRIVSSAFRLPYPDAERVSCESVCAITGERIDVGYQLSDIVSKTESNPERFYDSEFVSVDAARLYQMNSSRRRGVYGSDPNERPLNLGVRAFAVFGGVGYEPLASRDSSADAEYRPCWSDLVREVWPRDAGHPCVVIISTSGKTRVWNQTHVRAGVLGHTTPVVLYDPPQTNALVIVDWPAMLRDLDTVEEMLTGGWWMSAIERGLFIQRKGVDVDAAMRWQLEQALNPVRQAEHWPIIKIIARAQEAEPCLQDQSQACAPSKSSRSRSQLALF